MGCPVASPVVPHNFRRFLIRQDIGHPACLRPLSRMRGRCAWFAGLRAGKLNRRRCDLPTDPGWSRFAELLLVAHDSRERLCPEDDTICLSFAYADLVSDRTAWE